MDAPLVMLFHLIDFADPLPSGMADRWTQRLFTLSHVDGTKKVDACRRMLEHVHRTFSTTETARLVDAVRRRSGEVAE